MKIWENKKKALKKKKQKQTEKDLLKHKRFILEKLTLHWVIYPETQFLLIF